MGNQHDTLQGEAVQLPLISPESQQQHRTITEVPQYTLQSHLGGARFLVSLLCKDASSGGARCVVKFFKKRDPGFGLSAYKAKLTALNEALTLGAHPNVLPYTRLHERDCAAYLVRPFLSTELRTRIGTRPFMTEIEKCWVAFQLLSALEQLHATGFCHGDVKAENILLTSWDWCVLCDFALFKPKLLSEDNTAEFSYYFDTMGRRTCYVAPERFVTASQHHPPGQQSPLTAAMDIFSAGCAIAELFLDGEPLFDLAGLTAYRKAGGKHPEQLKAKFARLSASASPALSLVKHMTQLDASTRLSASEYLARWPQLFPSCFSAQLHPLLGKMLSMDPDRRIHTVAAWTDKHGLATLTGRKRGPSEKRCDECLVLLAVVLASVRCAEKRSSRLLALSQLQLIPTVLEPQHVLERSVPYATHMLRDEAGIVRAQAVRTLSELLGGVCTVLECYSVLVDYVLPGLDRLIEREDMLSGRSSALVCDALAHQLAPLLQIAQRAHSACVMGKGSQEDFHSAAFEQMLLKLLTCKVVVGNSPVQRRLVMSLASICALIGNVRAINLLVPMVAPIIDGREAPASWLREPSDAQLAIALLRVIPSLVAATCSGGSWLLPCVLKALEHHDESVCCAAARALASMCELEIVGLATMNDAAAIVAPLLVHPSQATRLAVVDLFVTAAAHRSLVQTAAMLLPLLRGFLTCEPDVGCTDSHRVLASLLLPPRQCNRAEVPSAVVQPQDHISAKWETEVAGCGAPDSPIQRQAHRAVEAVRGQQLMEMREHTAAVRNLLVADTILYSGSDDGTIKLWQAPSVLGDCLPAPALQTYWAGGRVSGLCQLEDGQVLASTVERGLVTLSEAGVASFATSAGLLRICATGQLAVCACVDNRIVGIDHRMGWKPVWAMQVAGGARLSTMEPGQDGQWLCAGDTQGMLSLWDLRYHSLLQSIEVQQGAPIRALASHPLPQGQPLIIAAAGNSVSCWVLESMQRKQVVEAAAEVQTLLVTPGTAHVLIAGAEQAVQRWDLDQAEASSGRASLECLNPACLLYEPVHAMAMSEVAGEGCLFTGSADGAIRVYL